MDKKSLLGIVLIGVIFGAFMIYNNYKNKNEVETAIENGELSTDSLKTEQVKDNDTDQPSDVAPNENKEISHLIPLKDSLVNDSLIGAYYKDTVSGKDTFLLSKPIEKTTPNNSSKLKERFGSLAAFAIASGAHNKEYVTLKNDKLKVTLSNFGGNVVAASVMGHKTYDEYAATEYTQATAEDEVPLFEESATKNGLSFNYDGRIINTNDLNFQLVENSENKVVYRVSPSAGKYIDFIYTLKNGESHINYSIAFQGMGGSIQSETVMLESETKMLRTERLMKEQRRVATVFYKNHDDKFDYLSETSTDSENEFEYDLDWVCFKQSYFSTFLMPEQPFKKAKSSLEIYQFDEEKAEEYADNEKYIKKYKAKLNLGLSNTDNSTTSMKWYFGTNDYDVLKAYDNDAEDINNYGWGLFRWINVWAIQPLFNWLMSFGMTAGLAIFLLTLAVKLALSPVNFKMYTSSAKMKILKPEIDAINAKYPNKEDAMKKQQEVMALQNESGASPLAGCVPMLIQMPILFAVFRFFPTTFALRQKSFLWAEDLSSYDSIAEWSTEIWGLSSIYGNHVSLFTLLMAITTLFYTHINSGQMQQPTQEGMPNMKVIMYFFPIMMIFFFNSYASGLSYYYFISTLMSIGIMYGIKKWFVDEDKIKAKMAERKAAANAPGGKKKKSGFAERLEQMQKAQQDKMKNQGK